MKPHNQYYLISDGMLSENLVKMSSSQQSTSYYLVHKLNIATNDIR